MQRRNDAIQMLDRRSKKIFVKNFIAVQIACAVRNSVQFGQNLMLRNDNLFAGIVPMRKLQSSDSALDQADKHEREAPG